MNSNQQGEVRCMLCGRYVADIEVRDGGRLHLSSPRNSQDDRITVRVVAGKLHCGRCGGRAWVEWDMLGARMSDTVVAA